MLTATEFASQHTAPNLAEPAALSRETGSAALAEIVVFIDGRTKAGGILEFAGALAGEHGARLIGVFLQPEPTITPAEAFARGTGMLRVSELHRAQLERIDADYRALFDDIVRRHGIPRPEWRSLSHWSNEVAVQAYYADLVVIARPEAAGQVPAPSGLPESLVLSSGRPIIIFPPTHRASRIRRILVGWSATREAIRAVVDALPLLARAEAVRVLMVDDERQRERHGQKPGADIARRLSALGPHVEVQCLSSGGQEVGQLLLAQARAFRADLLVMGAYGHSTLQEWLFGGVTRTVLYEAGLPVLMSR